jgi:peptide-methionine (S)-S-oxide reductase
LGLLPAFIAALPVALLLSGAPIAAEPAVEIAPPAVDDPGGSGTATAVLAGGCFWGVQAVFQHVKGVARVLDGYSGGTTANPSYREVTTGRTGHAESVEIKYDPQQISYGKLLQIFFSVAHNPTQLNYQGPDHGTQYRSAIFYENDAQKQVAEAYVAQLGDAKSFPDPIVTEITKLDVFYPAEAYHQDYALNNPDQPYIVYNDAPKVENLKRLFPELWRDDPVRVAAATQ